MMRPIAILLILAMITHACERSSPSAPKNNDRAAAANLNIDTSEGGQVKPSPISPPDHVFEDDVFTIVMLGDSITAGYGLGPQDALPVKLDQALDMLNATAPSGNGERQSIDIVNAGVSGDTTGDALNRFDWSVIPQADALLIALGGNDLLQGVRPSVTKSNLDNILRMAVERDLTIMIAGMRAPGNYGASFQRDFDRLYPDLAKKYNAALYPFLLEGVATDQSLNQADGIHPNKQGVAVIVDGLSGFIATTLAP